MNIFLTTKERRAINARNHLSQAELVYLVTDISDGTSDEEILKQVSDASPLEIGYAPRTGTRITDRPGQKSCEVSVTYAPESDSDDVPLIAKRAGDEIWLLLSKSGREKRYRAFATAQYPIGATVAPDAKNWIRWNGGIGTDFRAAGSWVNAPKMQEKCIRTFKTEQITQGYRRTIMEAVGKVNLTTFRGWNPGEALLVEVRQSKEYRNEADDWLTDVTFLFSISPNELLDVDQHIISVGGWQLPWGIPGIDDCWELDTAAFYVSTVYRSAEFSNLGIGRSDSGAALRRRLRKLDEASR